MTLRELLDNVRFGNVSRLCVAVYSARDFLDNYNQGHYWELTCGNWDNGSASEAEPEIPSAIMDARVLEVDAAPNLRDIYAELGALGSKSRDTTVILVQQPTGFNASKYWAKEDSYEPAVQMDMHEWAYNITKEKWEEIQELTSSWPQLTMAIYNLIDTGVDTIQDYTDEDFEEMDDDDAELFRLTRDIAMKITDTKEVLALCALAGIGTAFTKRLK